MSGIDKVVLAYSGGLDTSIILRWLQDTYNCAVVTFTADIGQGEEVEPARAKAELMGVGEIYIDDPGEVEPAAPAGCLPVPLRYSIVSSASAIGKTGFCSCLQPCRKSSVSSLETC